MLVGLARGGHVSAAGKAPSWLTVFSARMPFAFTAWIGKVSFLDKKLTVGRDITALVRARVDDINTCLQARTRRVGT